MASTAATTTTTALYGDPAPNPKPSSDRADRGIFATTTNEPAYADGTIAATSDDYADRWPTTDEPATATTADADAATTKPPT